MPTTETFTPGPAVTWVAPAGVTTVFVDAAADGSSGTVERRTGTWAVTPSRTLWIAFPLAPSRQVNVRRDNQDGAQVVFASPDFGGGSSPDLTGTTLVEWQGDRRVVLTYDRPPHAPSLLSPAVDATIDRARTLRFRIAHSDPDGDPLVRWQLEWRPAGTSDPGTTVTSGLTADYIDIPGDTFPAGPVEWRARSSDQGGYGAWSSWRQFVAADIPSDVVIMSPTSGQFVTDNPTLMVWTTEAQDAFELFVRDLIDGDPGPYGYSSGVVEDPAARSHPVPVTTVVEQRWFLRTRLDGLWSEDVSVDVALNPNLPAMPTVAVDDTSYRAAIAVQASHPAPSGDEPAVASVDVWRRRHVPLPGGGEQVVDEVRVATLLAPEGIHVDRTVASGQVYSYRVLAVATTGATVWSDWTLEPTPIPGFYGGGYDDEEAA